MKGKYIVTSHSGKNALDFYIAYYIGKFTEETKDKKVSFFIVSKDKGYDGLISFLESNRISIARYSSIESIFTTTKTGNVTVTETNKKEIKNNSINEKVKMVIEDLKKFPKSIPRKEASLKNRITHSFNKVFNENDADEIINFMKKEKLIIIDSKKIKYQIF